MYWGIIGVSAIAFSCSTELIPEINEKMRLVPFTSDFKFTMTATMVIDYVGCYVIEKVLKALFSDYKPKDIAVRRPDQLAREERRKEQALKDKIKAEEEKAAKEVEEAERKLQEQVEEAERKLQEKAQNALPRETAPSSRAPHSGGRHRHT
jgi:manganese-transporting P-type ATPase